jgi:hypothetical protein
MKNFNRSLRKDISSMRYKIYEDLVNCISIKIQGKVDTDVYNDVNDQVREQLFRPVLDQIKNEQQKK